MTVRPRGLLLALVILLLLAGCGRAQPDQRAVQQAQATQAANQVQTEIARASQTPTPTATLPPTNTPEPPTATPTVPVLTITPPPGLVRYDHPQVAIYAFQIDPDAWQADEAGNLAHRSLDGCRIESVQPQGIGQPEQQFWLDLGRWHWQILDYGRWAMAFPTIGATLYGDGSAYLNLIGYDRRACRAAQEQVLADLLPRAEADGEAFFAPYASPTPRPALADFSCPDAPPARLRVGDEVAVVTNGLWLRSEPRADNSTKLRQFGRNPPYVVRITGGPVCESYVYWQVEVSAFGEGGETLQGWLAEGDFSETYLLPVR